MKNRTGTTSLQAFLLISVFASPVFPGVMDPGEIKCASRAKSGKEANGASLEQHLSKDGRFAVFSSHATNLVPGDSNLQPDVFLRDVKKGKTTRISVTTQGVQSNQWSLQPRISANGRFIVFASAATDLDPAAVNPGADVFIHDRKTGKTKVAFQTGVTANCYPLDVSSNGRFICFDSNANGLVQTDNNSRTDVFVADRKQNTIEIASVSTGGVSGNDHSTRGRMSDDGRYVTFVTAASNFEGPNNIYDDVYVRDRVAGITTPVSIGASGQSASGHSSGVEISGKGRWIVFVSTAANLVPGDLNGKRDVFRYDRKKAKIIRVSFSKNGGEVNGDCYHPSVSDNGRYVVFDSLGKNLVSNDKNDSQDVFIFDVKKSKTNLLSYAMGKAKPANSSSNVATVSGNGKYVVFQSYATDLTKKNQDSTKDVFVRRP